MVDLLGGQDLSAVLKTAPDPMESALRVMGRLGEYVPKRHVMPGFPIELENVEVEKMNRSQLASLGRFRAKVTHIESERAKGLMTVLHSMRVLRGHDDPVAKELRADAWKWCLHHFPKIRDLHTKLRDSDLALAVCRDYSLLPRMWRELGLSELAATARKKEED